MKYGIRFEFPSIYYETCNLKVQAQAHLALFHSKGSATLPHSLRFECVIIHPFFHPHTFYLIPNDGLLIVRDNTSKAGRD